MKSRHEIDLGNGSVVTVNVRPHPTAKSLKLKPVYGNSPVMSVPYNARDEQVLAFLKMPTTIAWLRRNVVVTPKKVKVSEAGTVPILGNQVKVVLTEEKSTVYDPVSNELRVGKEGPAAAIRKLALDTIVKRQAFYCSEVDRTPRTVKMDDSVHYWGRCSDQGRMTYSWRLVMAPEYVLDYVTAHEVAHLVHLNHSDKFWAVVARICPRYLEAQEWLRMNGRNLHQWELK
jgi:predicted metal-dependent hydrolase